MKTGTKNQFRLVLIWLILMSGILGLGYRLYKLQIIGKVENHDLAEEGLIQRQYSLNPYIPRRPIIDRYNNTLASDRIIYTLYAHPKLFKHRKLEIAQALNKIFTDKQIEALLKQFNLKESGIRIKENLSESQANEIKALRINEQGVDGLEVVPKYARFYPQKNTVSDVIGYVQVDSHKGQAGIESSQQKLLARAPKVIQLIRDGKGNLMPLAHQQEVFWNFDDLKLQLTISLPLQRVARNALKEQIEEYQALRGSIIAMDITDGSIIAMVSEPSYDPNNYSQFDVSLFKNWSISDLYEPGSTFKPINMAIAFEEGIIDDKTTVYDTGKITIDKSTIFNHDYHDKGPHGNLNLAQILQYSSNISMISIMSRIKSSVYYDRLKSLGIEELTGIDLPGEVEGRIKEKSIFTAGNIESATASFGQGFSVTPIKVLQLQAAIANGGKLVTPHVVKGLVDSEGVFAWRPQFKSKQIFSPKTTDKVVKLMEAVVTDGSGEKSQVTGYRIAGKTGTSQKANPDGGGYLPNAKITSFVAIVPVESPRYAVIVVVDEPKKPYSFGSTVAAPVAKKVLDALIVEEKIPPSEN